MNIFLMLGISIVNLALVSYSIFFFLKKNSYFEKKHLIFLLLGFSLDIISTTFMILGTGKHLLTFHGIIGYIALCGMLIESLIVVKHYIKREYISKNSYNFV